MSSEQKPPILAGKKYTAASVFEPANLLREARRQRGLPQADVPEICLLEPDGDILTALRRRTFAGASSSVTNARRWLVRLKMLPAMPRGFARQRLMIMAPSTSTRATRNEDASRL